MSRLAARHHYSEKDAATVFRAMVEVRAESGLLMHSLAEDLGLGSWPFLMIPEEVFRAMVEVRAESALLMHSLAEDLGLGSWPFLMIPEEVFRAMVEVRAESALLMHSLAEDSGLGSWPFLRIRAQIAASHGNRDVAGGVLMYNAMHNACDQSIAY